MLPALLLILELDEQPAVLVVLSKARTLLLPEVALLGWCLVC
jgi:hypothetical protein